MRRYRGEQGVLSLLLKAHGKPADRSRSVLRRLGLWRDALDTYDFLLDSSALASFPRPVRAMVARKRVVRFRQGRDVGSLVPGFHPFLVPRSAWAEYPDIALARGQAPPQTLLPVVARRYHDGPVPGISVGLHIHAFFADGLPAIRDAVRQNRTLPDLYVTGPENNRAAVAKVLADYPRPVRFVACENLGRDVVPFLRLLPQMRAAGHDLVGHVHVKKSGGGLREGFVRRWSDFLLTSVIGDPERGTGAIDDIAADFVTAAVRPSLYLPQMSEALGWGKNRHIAAQVFQRLHPGPLPERFVFSPGTMFWATPSYLQPFEALDLPWHSLAPEPLPRDGTILHAIERLFGALAAARGDKVAICQASNPAFVLSPRLMRRLDAAG
jgi:hypothetical protein